MWSIACGIAQIAWVHSEQASFLVHLLERVGWEVASVQLTKDG